MVDLYFIMGSDNVKAWDENEPDEINLDCVYHKTFSNLKEKQIFIDALYLSMSHTESENFYTILDGEDEYRFLTT